MEQGQQQGAANEGAGSSTTAVTAKDGEQSEGHGQGNANTEQERPTDQPPAGVATALAKPKKAGKGKGKGRAKGKAARSAIGKAQNEGAENEVEPAYGTRSVSESRKRRRVTGESIVGEQAGTASVVRGSPGASFAQTARALDDTTDPLTEAPGAKHSPASYWRTAQPEKDNDITIMSDTWGRLQKAEWNGPPTTKPGDPKNAGSISVNNDGKEPVSCHQGGTNTDKHAYSLPASRMNRSRRICPTSTSMKSWEARTTKRAPTQTRTRKAYGTQYTSIGGQTKGYQGGWRSQARRSRINMQMHRRPSKPGWHAHETRDQRVSNKHTQTIPTS